MTIRIGRSSAPPATARVPLRSGAPLRPGFGSGLRAGSGSDPQPQGFLHRAEGGGLPESLALPVLDLLVLDEDDSIREACLEIARGVGFNVVGAKDVLSAREILRLRKIDLLLLDLRAAGLGLIEEVKTLTPETSIIVMTAFATVSSAVEAMRIGASDYLTKPFALEELVRILERTAESQYFDLESRRIRERLRSQRGAGPLIGKSLQMEKLFRILSKVAHSSHPVLITGESGTGKELVARSIHFNGPNRQQPFVPVDCGSMIPARLEGELFGISAGAVGSGPAARAGLGLLASAEGGTVFLDEIAELSLDLQARLLRALQEKAVRPVGAEPGSTAIPISARVLAASNRDLVALVEQGRFRKDLYFRLNVVGLRIPPLRERRDDIPLLAQHFLERATREHGDQREFSDDALRAMMAYDWPGNVRELEAAVDRAYALSSGPVLHMADLPTQLQDFRMHHAVPESDRTEQAMVAAAGTSEPGGILPIAEIERQAILSTIRQLRGDKLMAAKLLGIGKTTLYRKLKEYGITDDAKEFE